MNKHTQGPWTKGNGGVIFPEEGGYSIATCSSTGPHNRDASASLIAAAPELLEALIKYKRYFELCIESQDPPDMMGLHTEVRRLTNIINKAEINC